MKINLTKKQLKKIKKRIITNKKEDVEMRLKPRKDISPWDFVFLNNELLLLEEIVNDGYIKLES